MEKLPPPLLGFNNNVRHQGRVFHIQTEDSGVRHARIVTHLFADGGRILKTTRTDYSERIGRKDMAESLRVLMKEQHKAMFIALRAGELDAVIEGVFAAAQSDEASREAKQREPATIGTHRAASAPEVRDDSDAEETQKLVPLTREAIEAAVSRRPSTEPEATRAARDTESAFPSSEPGSVGARPAPVFDMLHKPERSIFGEGVLSEESLDDVILSYLADDHDKSSPKT